MDDYRANPPKTIGGSPVITIKDYLSSESLDVRDGKRSTIGMEKSNVLQFSTENNTIVSIRPSGTEPKIKYYFGICEKLPSKEQFDAVQQKLDKRLKRTRDRTESGLKNSHKFMASIFTRIIQG